MCWKTCFSLRGLVVERDAHAVVQIAGDLDALPDRLGVELDLRKDRRVGPEEHAYVPDAARRTDLS